MIWGHHKILERLDELFPLTRPYKIGSASVDVRVGKQVILESSPAKEDISVFTEDIPWIVQPNEFILVEMMEHTVIPDGVSCLFLLKSSSARAGWSHSFAGWIDPGWDGILTMELKNYNQNKPLPLWPGMAIGQLIYMDTDESGVYRGRYQHSTEVSGVRKEIEYDAGA